MMKRIPEPELMEDEEQALAYSHADFTTSNQLFTRYILKDNTKGFTKILDLGCGPADIDINLAKELEDIRILAIDGSTQMISLAKKKIEKNGLSGRIEAKVGRLPGLHIPAGEYDVIVSKDLLHHLPDPQVLWQEIKRLSGDNTIIYVMDLIRPESKEEAGNIVDKTSSNEPEVLKTDFYNSLLAAFTMDEIKEQLEISGLKYKMERLGDRHFVLQCEKQ